MIKGLLYKEWVKTRWCLLALLLLALCATGYAILTMHRVVTLKGMGHLWEILLSKDVLFIEVLKYQPAVMGGVLALVQYVPEMVQKRLKLTLHLPLHQRTIVVSMLGWGLVLLLFLALLQNALLLCYFAKVLAPELTQHILYSSAPWFMASFTAYTFTALAVLEPTWRRRVLNIFVGLVVLRLYFAVDKPRGYEDMLLPLALFSFLLCGLPVLSIHRFKKGVQ